MVFDSRCNAGNPAVTKTVHWKQITNNLKLSKCCSYRKTHNK